LNFEALSLQRQDLAADERMADFGVLVDEISNFQDRIQRRPRTSFGLLLSCMDLGGLMCEAYPIGTGSKTDTRIVILKKPADRLPSLSSKPFTGWREKR
jgi:hypothetical protein